jgi:hypothetical protein
MGVGFFDSIDRMDFGNHHVRERSLIRDIDEHEDVRLAEAGIGLLDSRDVFEGLQDRFSFSGFHFDQDVGFRGHAILLQQKVKSVLRQNVAPGMSRRRAA